MNLKFDTNCAGFVLNTTKISTGRKSSAPLGFCAAACNALVMMRHAFKTHTSLSLGALNRFTFLSSSSASAIRISMRNEGGMSKCSGLMNVESALMRRDRYRSARLSSSVTPNKFGCSFVSRYFSRPSPEASSSSSLAFRHTLCPRNARSVSVRNR